MLMRRLSALMLLLAGLLPGPAAAQDEDPLNPLLRVALRTEMPEQERTHSALSALKHLIEARTPIRIRNEIDTVGNKLLLIVRQHDRNFR